MEIIVWKWRSSLIRMRMEPDDHQEQCPHDPDKIVCGQCGCGVADIDADRDTVADCRDLCPADPAKAHPGLCGCGDLDADTNQDGVIDLADECDKPTSLIQTGQGCASYPTTGSSFLFLVVLLLYQIRKQNS